MLGDTDSSWAAFSYCFELFHQIQEFIAMSVKICRRFEFLVANRASLFFNCSWQLLDVAHFASIDSLLLLVQAFTSVYDKTSSSYTILIFGGSVLAAIYPLYWTIRGVLEKSISSFGDGTVSRTSRAGSVLFVNLSVCIRSSPLQEVTIVTRD